MNHRITRTSDTTSPPDSRTANCDLSFVIPVHNEEDNIPLLFQRLQSLIAQMALCCEIIFVDDGSNDRSPIALRQLYAEYPGQVKVIRLSRNFGHQLALTAGLRHCRGRCAVVMDADLQDPPEVVKQFVAKWDQGYEVVTGVRSEREGETLFKKWSASFFYKLIRYASKIDIPENAGDFYLLDRKVIDILNGLKERHRFIRGLVAWTGFRRADVPYVRHGRHGGKTKYSLWKMIQFSLDAFTSFSFTPLRIVSWAGALLSMFSFLSILVIIYMKLFTDSTIVGWSSIMAVVLFIGGVQLLSLGVIGEYVARIGDDVKDRPLYTVSEILDGNASPGAAGEAKKKVEAV